MAARTLKVGQSYASARSDLLASGWLPLRDPGCWENVGGAAAVCGVLPEVESCSADGYCLMHFANSDQGLRVRVATYGPYEQWNVPGREAEFAVRSSSLQSVERIVAAACPAEGFDAFLQAFASDDRIERAFTAPLVRVIELSSTEDGDYPRPVLIAGADYTGFNVTHRDGAFHHVDHEGKVDAAPLVIAIVQDGPGARLVRYRYGMSEGNSYRFERREGCWYLTGDPEPPAP